VAAFDGEEQVGFAAVTPRLVRYDAVYAPVYILSFVAVRPAWRGQSVATRLYATLLEELRGLGIPIVTFAEPGTGGQRRLLQAYTAAGFTCHPLGSYVVHGYIERSGSVPPAGLAYADADPEELLPIIQDCQGEQTLWSAPERPQLEHYRADPRPRALVVARRADGTAAGAAFLVQAEVESGQGTETVTMIDSLFLPLGKGDAEVLRGFFYHASRRWSSGSKPSIVTASNLRAIDPAIIRAAGLRQTPGRFEGYLCVADAGHPWLTAERTTLEVV
jgi:GNAT superfamily N-acetyltransferase